jgi:hypothetical protein
MGLRDAHPSISGLTVIDVASCCVLNPVLVAFSIHLVIKEMIVFKPLLIYIPMASHKLNAKG